MRILRLNFYTSLKAFSPFAFPALPPAEPNAPGPAASRLMWLPQSAALTSLSGRQRRPCPRLTAQAIPAKAAVPPVARASKQGRRFHPVCPAPRFCRRAIADRRFSPDPWSLFAPLPRRRAVRFAGSAFGAPSAEGSAAPVQNDGTSPGRAIRFCRLPSRGCSRRRCLEAGKMQRQSAPMEIAECPSALCSDRF